MLIQTKPVNLFIQGATARTSQLIAAGTFHFDDLSMRTVMHD